MTNCVALILAGGRGKRLGSLTIHTSKPAVHFGVDKRLIDYALQNCMDSGIITTGVISQYYSDDLHKYINSKYKNSGLYMLPSYLTGKLYLGTADAIYKNIRFVDRFSPDNVLILSGSQIYHMDYKKLLAEHQQTRAAATVAYQWVGGKKDTNTAPMGVYLFNWEALKNYLIMDAVDMRSQHNIEKSILPLMRQSGEIMHTYEFNGYWRDVKTVENLWEANMELLDYQSSDGYRHDADYYISGDINYFHNKPAVHHSAMFARCSISGMVEHSILGDSVMVMPGSEVVNSIIMPDVYIGNNVRIYNAIIGAGAVIMENTAIGIEYGTDFFLEPALCTGGVSLVEPGLCVPKGLGVLGGSNIDSALLAEWVSIHQISA